MRLLSLIRNLRRSMRTDAISQPQTKIKRFMEPKVSANWVTQLTFTMRPQMWRQLSLRNKLTNLFRTLIYPSATNLYSQLLTLRKILFLITRNSSWTTMNLQWTRIETLKIYLEWSKTPRRTSKLIRHPVRKKRSLKWLESRNILKCQRRLVRLDNGRKWLAKCKTLTILTTKRMKKGSRDWKPKTSPFIRISLSPLIHSINSTLLP